MPNCQSVEPAFLQRVKTEFFVSVLVRVLHIKNDNSSLEISNTYLLMRAWLFGALQFNAMANIFNQQEELFNERLAVICGYYKLSHA